LHPRQECIATVAAEAVAVFIQLMIAPEQHTHKKQHNKKSTTDTAAAAAAATTLHILKKYTYIAYSSLFFPNEKKRSYDFFVVASAQTNKIYLFFPCILLLFI
jgi:hypothetical protein